MIETCEVKFTAKDLQTDGPVKWCAGCGDHSVLSAIQRAIPETGVKKENVVVVSGIGCSSRFPYYMKTYGFHTLHGRGAAVASGLKSARPELQVWLITGDGDSMAIGGNHFIHLIRRNININVAIFNNRIYGLTKGQYSPTTKLGQHTATSPDGVIERPFEPGELIMGAQGTFFARAIDRELRGMSEIFLEAAKHEGTSVVEVLQNCVIFNDGTHNVIINKDVKEDRLIFLKHGEKMIFGKESNKGLILGKKGIEAVTIGENGVTIDDILVHDANSDNTAIHYMLARMQYPELPVAIGVIRAIKTAVYEEMLHAQVKEAVKNTEIKNLKDLLNSGQVFEM